MSGFDAGWLALREPLDRAARDRALTAAFVAALGDAPQLLDLGCGSGANLRYLARYLPKPQRWRCFDHDPALLAAAEASAPAGVAVAFERWDLATELEDLPIDAGIAVTASAFLDLTSAAWLERLAGRCRSVPLLVALSFDGRLAWMPPHGADEAVRCAFLRHQRTDKGFGPALGPDAARHFGAQLRALGQEVRLAPSDWRLGSEDRAMLEQILAGILAAVSAIGTVPDLVAWRRARQAQLDAGELSLVVGHLDLLALPSSRHGLG